MADPLNALPIIINPLLERTEWKQVRVPRSKKKRIQNKWSRDRSNWAAVPVAVVLVAFGAVYANQRGFDRLKKRMSATK